jgi:Ca2+-binding EF-hand superfamily protein
VEEADFSADLTVRATFALASGLISSDCFENEEEHMKKFFALMFLTSVMLAGAGAARAQDHPPQMPPPGAGPGGPGGMRMQMQMPTFADLDKNKDKKLTRDEFPSQMPPQFFDRLDENKDGSVDEEEFNRMRSGRTEFRGPRFGETLGKYLDSDNSGKVTREEFAKLAEVFDQLDQNKDGELTQEEMNRFFQAVNEAHSQATGGVEVANLFTKYDKDKDGKITAEEMGNERAFKGLDLNKDGSVTRDEAGTAVRQMAEKARAKKEGQPQ